MASNLYHLLSFLPATEAWEMPPMLEMLAQQLVASGKLRINADHERNFVRHGDMTFTSRELTDPTLSAATRDRLSRHVAPAAGIDGVTALWSHLRDELKKARGIHEEKEMRVARVLVQSAHPVVIQLLLQSGTEIYISYAHNVADLMAIEDWETHGANSGLQATDGAASAVYISAGGDPFFEGEEKTYTTDGFPALARMVIIAGQELGHFADLRRSAHGIIGRYSTDSNASQLRADPVAREARLMDRHSVAHVARAYHSCGLRLLRHAEKGVAFYHSRLRYSPPWMFYQLWRFLIWSWFSLQCAQLRLPSRLGSKPYRRCGEAIELYLIDMEYNLAPDADVYRHADPLVEEAIAVIEAVARVPQQIHKWGYTAVRKAWPRLTGFYMSVVLSGCKKAVSHPLETQNHYIIQSINIWLRRHFRIKPGYYPER